jgi:hypothetical protein
MRSFLINLIFAIAVLAVAPFEDNHRQLTPPPFDGHPPVHFDYLYSPTSLPSLKSFEGWIGIPYKYTGMAWKAWGEGIAVPDWSEEPSVAESAVRRFIDNNRKVFGVNSNALRTVKAQKHYRTWYFIFEQTLDGRRVFGARLDLRISPEGKLFFISNQLLPAAKGEFLSSMGDDALFTIALSELGLPAKSYRTGAEIWLPLENENGNIQLHRTKEIIIPVEDPVSEWSCFVDYDSRRTVKRLNNYYYLSGTITAEVMVAPVSPWNYNHTREVQWGTVSFGSISGNADVNGYYNFSASGTNTVIHELKGLYTRINDYAGAEPYFSVSASGGSVVNIHMDDSNSDLEERSGYVWAMRALQNTKLVDPTFTSMDYVVPCNVNRTGTCNAYWDGSSINFYPAGGGCQNTAQLKDVIMHEYAHGITAAIYSGSGFLPHLSVNECWSDYWPCTDANSPYLGRGFFGANTYLRNVDNTLVYPEDYEDNAHHDGQILGAAFWHTRAEIGKEITDTLYQFARYALPYNFFDNYYEVLIVDDDDANLANGTPNYCAIAYNFGIHGIGSGADVLISHTPLTDTENTTTPYPVSANVLQCPSYSWSADSVLVRWSIDGSTWNTALMATSDGYVYESSIPPQTAGTVIRYAVIAKNNSGNQRSSPANWPASHHMFIVGTPISIFFDDMEIDRGWTSGIPSDDATTGQWVREDPYQTYNTSTGLIYQSGDDHTEDPGVRCWVTGNAPMSYGAGYADVDNGKVTLLSPIIDLSGVINPILKYWRWFTCETSLDDSFWVWVSDDGSSWHNIDLVTQTQNWWTEVTVLLSDYISPSANTQFAFVATDYRSGSLVEAMIDDFGIYSYISLDVAEQSQKPDEYSIGFYPNPFNSALKMVFGFEPKSIEIFDINGKLVANPEPCKTVLWNAKNHTGEDLPSGIYFVRVKTGEMELIRKATLIR